MPVIRFDKLIDNYLPTHEGDFFHPDQSVQLSPSVDEDGLLYVNESVDLEDYGVPFKQIGFTSESDDGVSNPKVYYLNVVADDEDNDPLTIVPDIQASNARALRVTTNHALVFRTSYPYNPQTLKKLTVRLKAISNGDIRVGLVGISDKAYVRPDGSSGFPDYASDDVDFYEVAVTASNSPITTSGYVTLTGYFKGLSATASTNTYPADDVDYPVPLYDDVAHEHTTTDVALAIKCRSGEYYVDSIELFDVENSIADIPGGQDVLDALSDIASDGKLTPSEKLYVKVQYDAIVSEYGDEATIGLYYTGFVTGVASAILLAYKNAYDVLVAYVAPLLVDMSSTSDIVQATLLSVFEDYGLAKESVTTAIGRMDQKIELRASESVISVSARGETITNDIILTCSLIRIPLNETITWSATDGTLEEIEISPGVYEPFMRRLDCDSVTADTTDIEVEVTSNGVTYNAVVTIAKISEGMPAPLYLGISTSAPLNTPDGPLMPGDFFLYTGDTVIVDQLLLFDGTDDYAVIDETVLDYDTGDFTVSLWFKKDTVNASGTVSQLLEHWTGAIDPLVGVEIQLNGDGIEARVPTATAFSTLNGATYEADVWYNVVLSRLSGVARLFVNGYAVGDAMTSDGSITATGYDVYLGKDSNTASQLFDGAIRDVTIFSRALSSDEIGAIYAGADVPSAIDVCLTGAHRWLMNDGTGSSLGDSIGAVDGTISGATWDEITGDTLRYGHIYVYTNEDTWVESRSSEHFSAASVDALDIAKTSGIYFYAAVVVAQLGLFQDLLVAGNMSSVNYVENNGIPYAGFRLNGVTGVISARGMKAWDAEIYGNLISSGFQTLQETAGTTIGTYSVSQTLWHWNHMIALVPFDLELQAISGTVEGFAFTSATRLSSSRLMLDRHEYESETISAGETHYFTELFPSTIFGWEFYVDAYGEYAGLWTNRAYEAGYRTDGGEFTVLLSTSLPSQYFFTATQNIPNPRTLLPSAPSVRIRHQSTAWFGSNSSYVGSNTIYTQQSFNGLVLTSASDYRHIEAGGVAYYPNTRTFTIGAQDQDDISNYCSGTDFYDRFSDIAIGASGYCSDGVISVNGTAHTVLRLAKDTTGITFSTASGDVRVNKFIEGTNTGVYNSLSIDTAIEFLAVSGGIEVKHMFSWGGANNQYNIGETGARFNEAYLNMLYSNRARLDATNDVTLASTDHAFQTGASSGQNIAIGNNKIVSRNNGVIADLYVNYFTNGKVYIGSGGMTSTGPIVGTSLDITGSEASRTAGNYLVWSCPVINTISTSNSKHFEIKIKKTGTYTTSMTLTNGFGTTYGRVYKNGSAAGTARSIDASTITYTEPLAFVAGDLVQLYAYDSGVTGGVSFRLYCNEEGVLLNYGG